MGPGGGPGDSDALPPFPAASWRRGGRQASGACVHSVHGQRRRPRARLRRPVRGAAEGVPRPRARHQLHPGRRAALPPAPEGGAEREEAPGPALHCGRDFLPEAEVPWAETPPRTRMPGPERGWSRNCGAGDAPGAGGGDSRAPAHAPPRPAPAGARPGAVHGLARRRAAPLGRARAPARPAAAPRRRPAQPLPPLQQQGGLRRRRAAEAGLRPPPPTCGPIRGPAERARLPPGGRKATRRPSPRPARRRGLSLVFAGV